MAKKKKKMPSLNTTSTADISFMLLIFFLVTTSMDTDRGLAVRLPNPPEENQQDPPFLTQIDSEPPSFSKELRMTRIKVSIKPKILTRKTSESIS